MYLGMSSVYSRSNTARRSISNLQVTSTTLSHTVNNIDDTKAAVVIDIGRKLTKCGYSGEFLPRIICRTEYYDENCTLRRDFLDGFENGKKPKLGSLLKFFKYLFYSHLLVEPRDRKIIIVESVLYPTQFRKSLCTVLLEKLDVPSVMFMPGNLCATFPYNTSNALVIDMGYRETVAMPVAEGITMLSHSEITAVASSRLEDRLAELLLQHGSIESPDGELRSISEEEITRMRHKNILEDICLQHLFCTTRDRGLNIQTNDINAELEPKISDSHVAFGSEIVIVPGFVREAACEILFSNESEHEPALPHLIFSVVTKLSIDLRKRMFSGLLLTGGLSMMRGLLPRLQEELKAMGEEKQQKSAETIKFFRFEEDRPELYINWLGGSMFASMREALPCRSISRQQWIDEKILPDWTDFVQHSIPCGRTDMQG